MRGFADGKELALQEDAMVGKAKLLRQKGARKEARDLLREVVERFGSVTEGDIVQHVDTARAMLDEMNREE